MTAYRASDPSGGRNGPARRPHIGCCRALFYDVKAFGCIHVVNK